MAQGGQGTKRKHWCFTWNNYDQDDWDLCKDILGGDKCEYGIMAHEVAEAGTPHIQGFFVMKNRVRLTALKRLFGDAVHFEHKRGTNKEASDYCKKDTAEGDHPNYLEFGELPVEERSRTDLKKAIKVWEEKKDPVLMLEQFPTQWVMYGNKIKAVVAEKESTIKKTEWTEMFKDAELRPWQRGLIAVLNTQDNREILWVVDIVGGQGKTWLCNYMRAQGKTQVMGNMKSEAFNFAWDGSEVTIFDFERCVEDGINYSNIEKAKNGWVYSSKYEGKTTVRANAKILCFSNSEPDKTKLSADRWHLFHLNDGVLNVQE